MKGFPVLTEAVHNLMHLALQPILADTGIGETAAFFTILVAVITVGQLVNRWLKPAPPPPPDLEITLEKRELMEELASVLEKLAESEASLGKLQDAAVHFDRVAFYYRLLNKDLTLVLLRRNEVQRKMHQQDRENRQS